MTEAIEFPTPGYHVKGTHVRTATGEHGTVVRYGNHGSRGESRTEVLVRIDTKEFWYGRESLTVIPAAVNPPVPVVCPSCSRRWNLAAGTHDEQATELSNHMIGHYLPVTDAKLTGKPAVHQRVAESHQKALAYAWGRQDEAAEHDTGERYSRDTGAAQEFAGHYAFLRRNYEIEMNYRMLPLADAYKEWRDTGGISK